MDIQSATFYMKLSGVDAQPHHPSVLTANLPWNGSLLPSTKVVATVGPNCADEETLDRFIYMGVSGFRINMSHVGNDQALQAALQQVGLIRQIAHQQRRQVHVFADMKGPEFRVKGEKGSPLPIQPGLRVRVALGEGPSSVSDNVLTLYLEGPESYDLIRDLKANNERLFSQSRPAMLVADGNVVVRLDGWSTLLRDGFFWGTVEYGSAIAHNKGVNFPGISLPALPALTSADSWVLNNIFNQAFALGAWEAFGSKNAGFGFLLEKALANKTLHQLGFDSVAPSFVRGPEDMKRFQYHLEGILARHVTLVPKIETAEAAAPDTLREILRHPWVRGVMVARGDLAAQVGFEGVPMAQDLILEEARQALRFSIVATAVLESMKDGNPRATRAELAGIREILKTGGHVIQFSDETAVGANPKHVIDYIQKTLAHAHMEGSVERATALIREEVMERVRREYQAHASGKNLSTAALMQEKLYHDQVMSMGGAIGAIDGMVLWSERGRSMRLAAALALGIPVIVVTNDVTVAREAAITRGTFPILLDHRPADGRELRAIIEKTISLPPGRNDFVLQVMHNLG